ncbi:hypothetical protein LTR04_002101 [Oleoguttula sp. CCFEE 6159]|nr:hypothetical protein LTR04_002101 [Oleoguttula sp. CCFEE 6159]
MASSRSSGGPAKGSKSKAQSIKQYQKHSRKISDPSTHDEQNLLSSRISSSIPLEFQQLILNVFRVSFAERLGSDLSSTLQEVKQHLFNRDFQQAFGRDDYLEAYAVRWSSSRALGYLQIFSDLSSFVVPYGERTHSCTDGVDVRLTPSESLQEFSFEIEQELLNVVCLGGGAGAEIAALAGFMRQIRTSGVRSNVMASATKELDDGASTRNMPRLEVLSIDIASWASVVNSLRQSITNPPVLSKYASAAAKAANGPLLPSSHKTINFLQRDVLAIDVDEFKGSLQGADLVTIMFTLNELYTTSVPKTQRFLLLLTTLTQPGTLLLVVDSPGSYSTVTINGAEKRYPMHWLLDHTLLPSSTNVESRTDEPKWEKLVSDESRWFRLPEGLKYPIGLENMRYQIHLYKRCDTSLSRET